MSDVNKDQRKAHHKEQAGDDCDRDQKPSDVKGSHRNYAHFLVPAERGALFWWDACW
jgi:hypothetical protein